MATMIPDLLPDQITNDGERVFYMAARELPDCGNYIGIEPVRSLPVNSALPYVSRRQEALPDVCRPI